MATASWPPESGAGGIPTYSSFASLPASATDGAAAITLDTDILYIYNLATLTWIPSGGPGVVLGIGTIDTGTPSANGAQIVANKFIQQSASATEPGLVNTSAQTLAGAKTFSTAPILSSLTVSLPLQLDASKNVIAAAIDLSGSEATGILAAARFPALTGDLTTVAGALATTLATVNGNVGSFGSATQVATFTVNGKGLTTAAGSTSIQIAESQVTNLVSDLAGKQATGNYITALTGDVTASGPGSVAASLVATTNSTLTTLSALASVGTLTTGTWNATTIAVAHGGTGVTSVTVAPAATAWAGWDANKNLSANNHLEGYQAIATAAGTTALLVSSPFQTYFTGSTTQTVTMPVTSGLVLGQQYVIVNESTGTVTVQSSGANTIQAMAQNTILQLTCILTSGTGTASWQWTYGAVAATGLGLTNPMSTLGDTIYGAAAGAPTRLAGNTTAALQFLGQTGNGSVSAAPVWSGVLAPTISTATATGSGTGGFGGSQTGWVFTVSGWTGTIVAGDTYTNNSNTYTAQTVTQTNGTGQTLFMSGTGATSGSTLTKAVSASGPATMTFSSKIATATYTTPTSPRSPIALRIRMVGSGGGGGGGGTGGGTGTVGNASVFGPVMMLAQGGTGGDSGGTGFANGGSASVATITALITAQGGGGGNSSSDTAATGQSGTQGGGSYFGGQGAGGSPVAGGQSGGANTGGGGGGGGCNVTAAFAGGGGGAGGYAEAQASGANLLATFPYAVATAASGGSGGTGGQAGGQGAAGYIVVEEIYQ